MAHFTSLIRHLLRAGICLNANMTVCKGFGIVNSTHKVTHDNTSDLSNAITALLVVYRNQA